MTRMSKSISLVLINSALILAGCARVRAPVAGKDTDKETGKETTMEVHSAAGSSGGYYHSYPNSYFFGRGYYWFSSPSSGGGSVRPSGGGSVRPSGGSSAVHSGGFGSTGHAVGS